MIPIRNSLFQTQTNLLKNEKEYSFFYYRTLRSTSCSDSIAVYQGAECPPGSNCHPTRGGVMQNVTIDNRKTYALTAPGMRYGSDARYRQTSSCRIQPRLQVRIPQQRRSSCPPGYYPRGGGYSSAQMRPNGLVGNLPYFQRPASSFYRSSGTGARWQ